MGSRPTTQVYLKKMSVASMRIVASTEVSSITQTEFDDGNRSFIVNAYHIGEKDGRRFVMYRANIILKVEASGKMQFTSNGRLVVGSLQLGRFIQLFDMLALRYPEVFSMYPNFDIFDYHLSRNQKLLQLPCTRSFLVRFYYGLEPIRRNRVNYHLRRGNTHKATTALLGYDFPKSIRKMLLDDSNLAWRAEMVKEALQVASVDKVRAILSIKDYELLRLITFKPGITGWDVWSNHARDIMRMVNYGIDISGMPNNIRKLHDELTVVYNRVVDERKAKEWRENYKYHQSEYPVAMSDGLEIRPVVSSGECITIGKDLHICVGAYANSHREGKMEILVVLENGRYLACLEVYNNTLVQAKLSCNSLVSSNKRVHKTVTEYCELFGIEIDTIDML